MAYVGAWRVVWPLLAGLAIGVPNIANAARAAADGLVADTAPAAVPRHAPYHPRVKLSVDTFTIGNIDATPVRLTGMHLDAYPLSERWVRGGFALEAGAGHAAAVGNKISLDYGLLGLTAGLQYPGRVTPFIEGYVSGGLLRGRLEGSFMVGDTTVSMKSGTTWLYGRGINVGTELYVVGRAYVSVSLGWIRATWAAPDLIAQAQSPEASPRPFTITSDSLVWRLGLGI